MLQGTSRLMPLPHGLTPLIVAGAVIATLITVHLFGGSND